MRTRRVQVALTAYAALALAVSSTAAVHKHPVPRKTAHPASRRAAVPSPKKKTPAPLSFIDRVQKLENRQYLWAPQIAPEGEMVALVSLPLQRTYLYRNSVLIGVTSISSGRPEKPTYTGLYRTLDKQEFHRSNAYSNAPMPWMQQLTNWGVAMHGGDLPGYPASHGCIRLPKDFAQTLYEAMPLGTTVDVVNTDVMPRIAPPADRIWADANAFQAPLPLTGTATWHPEASPAGPITLVISGIDHRLLVVRNSIVIGSAPVQLSTPIAGTRAYTLSASDGNSTQWTQLELPGTPLTEPHEMTPEERAQFQLPPDFEAQLQPILTPGTTLLLTRDTLRPTSGWKMVIARPHPRRKK